ncbi:DNA gyrase subunit A [Cloacibacillus porcorum]|uniref:DNA gyrase subunit A n=1 Tax=Cloacibacillus porcorum TaxID=1197717 RepID=UPI0014596B21|nr:DNA gyrase subunit A [Cloacibacillus porcorum]MCC8184871.1 DNA gyrase subunit A [Cloacibacillus porcorum]MCI5864109.1 DNA gyrase subunit A [Cloacibacillus porcorum]MDY5391448.1 DNA gyrase subunit A [Cloacibacillus porcorum]NMF19052.1 DNA gyrase subunit A [Cloacibacillus porcorum]
MDHNSKQSNLFEINKVITLPLEEEIKQSYLNYAMSVIVGRALPDARDGLKPVQRRILYAMLELGVRHNQAFKKSARIVGETMGKYHPHGDAAIYDTMARLSQDFSMRYQLVDGQGNFGSIDGDPPAAMRYTEARLHALGEEMLTDINEETVDWGPNFDESLEEPLVLPSRIPNLLVNGSTGIAVGMATNMPPHNLGEAVDVCCAILDNPEVELGELMALMPGPDFPTGGIILGREGIIDAYRTGRGRLVVRGRVDVEEGRKGRNSIIISEIPYMVNKTNFIETIAKGVQSGMIDGISDLRDESDRNGMRIVVELQRDADPNLVLRQLYTRTQLQSTFGVINLAIVNGETRELPLKELVQIFLDHRREVVRRRTEFRLRKAEDRRHIVEGLLRALDVIDQVIHIIRSSDTATTARNNLIEELGFTEIQAQAILDMRLQRLTGLEREKLDTELAQLLMDIERYNSILSSHLILDSVVKDELMEIRRNYSDKRRTDIENAVGEVADEDLIPEEDIVVALSRDGYIRRMPLQDYRVQQRGGKGVKGVATKAEDEIAIIATTTTHRTLYLFTNKGRVFGVRGFSLPEPKTGKGKLVGTIITLEKEEKVVAIKDSHLDGAKFIFFVTKQGTAKRLPVEELDGLTRAGRRVLGLSEGDDISRVRTTSGTDDLLLTTALGQTLRVSEEEFRPLGRQAQGVRGIRLDDGDSVVGCDVVGDGRQVLFISARGIGKRTAYDEFTQHHRAGYGVRAMKLSEKTGELVGAWGVQEDEEIIVISSKGRMVRIGAKEISTLSRTATGYTIVALDEGDTVADISIVRKDDEEA